jgi:hypothetical protein
LEIAIMANLARIARVMTSKRIRHISLAAALTLGALNCAQAATINSASALLGDVTAAIASASNGDTVVVPAGTAHWASVLTITKGITLMGATTCDTSTALGTANDQTIIVDDNTRAVPSPNQIININLTPNQVFRMSGFTFRGGIGNLSNAYGVLVGGTCPGASDSGSFRIDHCHFDRLIRNDDVQTVGWVYGVIDHCIFYGPGFGVNVHHDTWGGGPNNYGDGSWAEPPYFGSNKFVFVEDNCITNATTNGSGSGIDAKAGGRMVIRYNFLNNAITSNHGTEAQRPRGGRVIEFYNNTVNYTFDFPTGSNFRSGTGVVFNNRYTSKCHGIGNIQAYRTFQATGAPYGNANGTNPWDVNSGGVVQIALDQPGRGKGDLITGDNPTPAWPHDALEPIYVWGNTVENPNTTPSRLGAFSPMQEGRDVYNDTPMPGYTPYTYPHPLVSGASPNPTPPGAPQNLHVVGP